MKVGFVCRGNTCRSPMLMYMFRAYADSKQTENADGRSPENKMGSCLRAPSARNEKDKILSENCEVIADSAGLLDGRRKMTDFACEVLKDNGIPFSDYFSKKADFDFLNSCDFVYTMEAVQKTELDALCGVFQKKAVFNNEAVPVKCKIVSVKDLIGSDVPDPYGSEKCAYENAYKKLDEALPLIYAYVTEN